jgi:uncharacterized membrane protein
MILWLISLTISTLRCETVLSVLCPDKIVTHFTHHIYTLVSNSFINFMSKWYCDSFYSPHLHFSVKQFDQFCVQMRLWLISLTISILSHPTVLWSWCPYPTVLSVWWSNEIVTYFTHFLYTLVTAGNRHKQNSWFCKEIREDNFRFWWRRVHEDASQGMHMSKI